MIRLGTIIISNSAKICLLTYTIFSYNTFHQLHAFIPHPVDPLSSSDPVKSVSFTNFRLIPSGSGVHFIVLSGCPGERDADFQELLSLGKINEHAKLMNTDPYDAIIIGSGAGGLSAGTVLSRAGARIVVLEAMTDYGGYLNPFQRNGYRFDAGMHYLGQLGEGGVFRALLQRLGVWHSIEFNQIDPDGVIRFHCGDLEFHLPAGQQAIQTRLSDRFPGEAAAIKRFLASLLAIDRAVESAADMNKGIGGFLHAVPSLPVLLSILRKNYAQYVESFTPTKELQAFLFMMNCGLPPQRAAALVPILMFRHYLDGAYYPKGGSGALRDALVGMITKNHGDLLNYTKVDGIRRDGELLTVTSGSRSWTSRSVICNADPTHLYGTLLDPALISRKLRKRVSGIVPSTGAFYAYVVTDLDLTEFGIGSGTIQHHDSLEAMRRQGMKCDANFGNFMLSCTTLKDPDGGHAPPGKHIIELVSQMPFEPFARWSHLPAERRGDSYRRLKERLGRQLIRKAERYIPDLSNHISYVNYATPLTNHYWVNAPGGGCYGPAHIPSQVGPKRFGNKSHIPGLFLCGHGTLAGGVYPSIWSGEIAASLALHYL